jgi:putative ABC transport system permease protein
MRKLTACVRLAVRSLARHRRRSVAMVAGMAAGVALLATVRAVGDAARRQTLAQVRNMLGTFDTVLVRPGAAATRGMVSLTNVPPTLRFADAAAIAALPAVRQAAELQNAFDIDAQHQGRDHTPAVFGVSANWLALRGDALARGSFFTPEELRSEARVAVLGEDVRRALFPGEDPLGQTVRLGDVPFRVQGVLAARGAGPGGFSLDDLVLIPVTTASRRLFNRSFLTMVVAQVRQAGGQAAALAQIRTLLRARHHIAAGAPDDFTLTDPSAVAAQLSAVGSRLGRILSAAGWTVLALGGVAILGLMALGVAERRAEIGLRRAVGASRADILAQFLVEAGIASAIAGGLGAALAAGAIAACAHWLAPGVRVPAAGLAAAALGAMLWGTVCGLGPAWHAARMDPVRGIRS